MAPGSDKGKMRKSGKETVEHLFQTIIAKHC